VLVGCKQGVEFHDLSPQMVLAHIIVVSVFTRRALDCIITSGSDGVHGNKSLHYAGNALDYRTRHMTETEAIEVHAEIRKQLPKDYDVINHPRKIVNNVVEHPGSLHIEYQPRRPRQ
jgi:hypothetical protein